MKAILVDWKYKHFHQQREFQAPREVILEAARAVMAGSLGWRVSETAEGFSASGSSFAHAATANFRVQSTAAGTRVDIDLLVERAGAAGFMLFDVGGYYNIQVRKWLEGIQSAANAKLAGQEMPAHPPLPPQNRTAACAFHGCLIFIVLGFGLYFIVTFVCAVIGLATGNLYLIGRGGTLAVHGVAGRIVSALILLFGAWIVFRIIRPRRSRRPNMFPSA